MPIETEYSRYLSDTSIDGAIAAFATILSEEARLRAFDNGAASKPREAGKWSRKEILGHLCDSASNNTQRIVRAQIPAHLAAGTLKIQGYAQNDWVRVQAFAARSWSDVIDLWLALNRHLLHIVRNVDRATLGTPIVIGDGKAVTLEYVIIDYVAHMRHHLKQIVD